MSKNLNYFTCTLGQAAQYKETVPEDERSFDTVLDLVDKQAEAYGDRPALGFADFSQDKTTPLSFRQLRELSLQATDVLLEALKPRSRSASSETVGMICSSGLDFVCTWLGLMRLGYTVFLLAPQLDHRGLKHLCETTNASVIFIDDNHYSTFQDVQDETLSLLKVPHFSRETKPSSTAPTSQEKGTDTAYLRHTSGTSSGLPKPIVQSQLGAVGVLARLPASDCPAATFSTTPLYHGGLADCFRSWSCAAPIWFFPESKAPITCANILKAVSFARDNTITGGGASARDSVNYFSSVPYVLQMLSEEQEGINMLKTMDLVGVGGAALPAVIGDRLVDNDVRLVSRMGSAECGFLLSSDRDYASDKEWQFLRCAVDDPDILAFEPQAGSELCELVAKPKWPLRNKTNREDGSFATSDLFQRHETIPNAWKYHSRSDAQITLANGKKFDPAPLEDAIRAALGKVLQDVLVFGAGQEYPGAILFGKSTDDTEAGILEKSWPAIEELNKSSSNQARLSKTALVCVVPQDASKKPLEKSSKGTLLRKQAEERYKDDIESVYSSCKSSGARRDNVSDEELPDALLEEFTNVLGRPLDMNKDLFQQGVDSMACIQLRRMISTTFLSKDQVLPLNVIYDYGTVEALAAHIAKLRKGQTSSGDAQKDDDKATALMEELVAKYSRADSGEAHDGSQAQNGHAGADGSPVLDTIVLTGATGLLGVHVLDALATMSQVSKIYCLVRGQDKHAAKERIRKALAFRNLDSWDEHGGKIVCLPANLTKPNLGIDDDDFSMIRKDATIVIHAAWTVNFSLRLKSFDNQIAGTRNLLDLADSCSKQGHARFYFISSTAAVGAKKSDVASVSIEEHLSFDPSDASPIGYAQSKWVAEQVCAAPSAKSSTTIIRIGQLCGNSKTGVWNSSEAYPLMLSTASITGSLPRLPAQGLNWLPVNQAAAAVVEIISGTAKRGISVEKSNEVPVYHVLQPNMRPTWDNMLEWLQESQAGPEFEVVPPSEWLSKLQDVLGATSDGSQDNSKDRREHPSASLLSFWQDRYSATKYAMDEGSEAKKVSMDETAAGQFLHSDADKGQRGLKERRKSTPQDVPEKSRFGVQKVQRVSKVMAAVKSLEKEQIVQMWQWICENVGKAD